jgi:protein ImuA
MQTKAAVLAQLQNEILSLQGFKPVCTSAITDIGLGSISDSFSNGIFPLAAMHEYLYGCSEDAAATSAFIIGLLSSVMHKDAISLWISCSRTIFPPALQFFGVSPDQIIFIDLKNEKEVSWAIEEAIRCKALAAVVGEMSEMSFTDSRRFQLAIEKSGVPCFILRHSPRNMATASVTRWHIKPLPTTSEEGLPGVVHPRWQVALTKVRNGKPGTWDLDWINGRFCHVAKMAVINGGLQKKAG